jgi:hypothetical protein
MFALNSIFLSTSGNLLNTGLPAFSCDLPGSEKFGVRDYWSLEVSRDGE